MATIPTPVSAEPGWAGERRDPRARWRGARGRRSVPHLLLGVLLVLACAVGFLLVVLDTGGRRAVWQLVRPVTVGHVLVEQDLRRIDVGVDGDTGVVAATSDVVGRPVVTSLPAGTLLSAGMVGPPLLPGAGQAVVAAAVKPGQVPPEVVAGSTVMVVAVPAAAVPGSGAVTPPGGEWDAVVTGVGPGENGQYTVVSLVMARDAARAVAGLPAGQVSIVLVPGGSG